MKCFPTGPLSALAALCVSTSAMADITADQVWQNWKTLVQDYGQTLTVGAEDLSGGTLTVTGLTLASEAEGGTTQATIDTMVFREQGDGTVEVTMSPQYPVTVTVPDDEGNTQVVNILVDQPGLVIVASGTEAETRYDIAAPTVNVAFNAPPSAASPADTQGSLAVAGLSGNYVVSTDVQSRIASTLRADSARLVANVVDETPQEGGTINIGMNVNALTSTTQAVVLPPDTMMSKSEALASGLSSDSTFGYGSADFSFDILQENVARRASGTVGAGTVFMGENKDRVMAGGTMTNASLVVTGDDMPVPEVNLSFAESAFDLLMPASPTEMPQDFRLLLRMVDLALPEVLWAQFDPGAALPRDPATLVIDTSGKARWLVDIFSPEARNPENAPGEVHALDINDLTLRAVGATLVGTGGFTFDNSDTTTFNGLPLPAGTLDLTLTGANALLDRLSQAGLLPQDQVMGARMMMGLFTRPGAEPDTLTTAVEFRDRGLFVNGQQLQ